MDKKHVFVDWYEVDPGYGVDAPGYRPHNASPFGVKIVTHRPLIEEKPIVKPDKPWDMNRAGMASVVKVAEGDYRMWYEAINGTPEWIMVCYATSKDGVNWVKPNLGLVEFQGSKENNIVCMEGAPGLPYVGEGDLVYYDEAEKDPNKRFKKIYTRVDYQGTNTVHSVDMWTSTSPDGLHWSEEKKACKGGDSFPGLIYLKSRGKYVMSTKDQHSNHLIRRTIIAYESSDFEHWDNGTIWLNGSLNDKPDMDYYTSPFWEWPGTNENAFVMMTSRMFRTEDSVLPTMFFSRDLNTWNMANDEVPLVGKEFGGGFTNYVSGGFIHENNKFIHFYTHFGNGGHNGGDGFGDPSHSATWRMIFREDGYTSLYAESHGSITTIPLNVGKGLILNAEIHKKTDYSWIKVAIEDDEGVPYEGFGLDDCKLEKIDDIHYRVTWVKDMSELPQKKNHRFKFDMFRAHLYSYTCLDCEEYENEDGTCPYRLR